MRVLVMGAGALGGYFGARLQSVGHDVTYVARGPHLEALHAQGLRVESPLGDLHLPVVRAVADAADAPPPDLALVMVKNRDLEAAGTALAPMLGPATAVVTVQNGVTAPERLGAIVGRERIVAAAVFMPADLRAPGVIRHSSTFHRIRAAVAPNGPSAALDAFMAACAQAGIEATREPDVATLLWRKFAFLAPFAALTALTRLDIGPIRECRESRALLRQAVDEVGAVGRAAEPGLPEDLAEVAWQQLTEGVGPATHASMLDDLMRGKPLELDYLSGEVVRRGAALGVPTPVHAMVCGALMPYAQGLAPAPHAG